MTHRRPPQVFFLFVLAVLLAANIARADEGMWPFNHIPSKYLQGKYNFEPADEFLMRLQKASVRLNNGGSGSFVSPRGLLMTNHHVASDCIRKLSSEKKDYIKDGFYAAASSAELKCPDLELNVLMEIEPVTEQVNRNVLAEMSDKDRQETQKAAIARIEKDCKDSTLMRCDVVNLYQGGIFDLYKYRRYTDVRLVFAPEFQIAFFGGDADNFTYPRYCLDVSFLRVYKDGKPIDSPAYLPLSAAGVAENDLVFVSGHPGSTERLLTLAQLDFERDRRIPFTLEWLNSMAQTMRTYGRGGPDAARLARDELFRFENSIKAYTGMLAGLRNAELMERKAAEEKKLRDAVENDHQKKKDFAGAWEAIAAAQKVKEEVYEDYRLVSGQGIYSNLFTIAKHLFELSQELPKPNEQRFKEYQDAALESLYQQIYSTAPVYKELEIVKLGRSLQFMRERLGRDHPVVQAALKGRHPDIAAKELIEGTTLTDVEFRKQLAENKAEKAGRSDDPLIALARAIDGEWRKLRKRYEDEVEAVENAQGARIARARFVVEGTGVYPDATFTLRLSIGTVKGYVENGKRIPPFTTFEGLYAKATGEDPYVLPKKFVAAKRRVKVDTPLNLVSTNDITGGNSGSPLISRGAEIVGLIFDGNIQSLSGDFLYSDTQSRAVSVDGRGIEEALRKVYNAGRLAAELTAARRSQ